MKIMQGDAYSVPIRITDSDGAVIDDTMADKVEVTIGFITKNYPGEITFSDGCWLFPLTQEETFDLPPITHSVQARVKLKNGDVIGSAISSVKISSSASREVL